MASLPGPDPTWHEATPTQQGIWALDRIERLQPAYMVPSVLELTGPVDHSVLTASVRRALSRHAALHSRFRLNLTRRHVEYRIDGKAPAVGFAAAGDDWPHEELGRHIHELCYAPFDLATGPLARAEVIRVDPVTTILVLTVHHIVFDGWSRRLVVEDIVKIYQAALRGEEPCLGEPAHPAAVIHAAAADELAARTASAVERLRDAPRGVALPYDRSPVGDAPLVSAVASVRFDPRLTGQLMTAAMQEGCTAFMAAVALLAGTLARSGKQSDFLFAVVWPGRDDPASHDVVGMFMNTVVLRVGLSERTTWRELLRAARAAALEAFVDGDIPLGAITAALDPGRDVSRPALTPVMINLADVPGEFELAPGTRGRYRPLDVMYSKWDMTMFVYLSDKELELSLDYPVQLFDSATIDDLLIAIRCSVVDVINSQEESVLEPSRPRIDLDDPAERMEIVRSTWREILGLEKVDDDVGFFDAGGDSLLLMALVEQLSVAAGRTLKTLDIFRAGTISGQAALLAPTGESAGPEAGDGARW
jgi:hypothetical protein